VAERYDAERSQSPLRCGYSIFMKIQPWNSQRKSAKKIAVLEKTVAHTEPSLVEALSLVRVNQLGKLG
jgi:hypothetical protein